MDKITQLYQHILPELKDIEVLRIQKLKHRKYFRIITLGILFPILLGIFIYGVFWGTVWTYLLGILLIGGFFSFYPDRDKSYEKKVYVEMQQRVIPEIGKVIDESLEYDCDHHVSFAHFQNSHLKDVDITTFSGGNFFSGRINNQAFQFSEVSLIKESKIGKSSSISGSNATYYSYSSLETANVITRGLFLVMELPSFYDNATFIFDKKPLGRLREKMNGKRGEYVRTNNPIFNKQFNVFGLDGVSSKELLSLQLQEQILKLNEYFDASLRISIIGENAYFFLENKKGIFNFDIKDTILDKDSCITQIFTEILSLLSCAIVIHENFYRLEGRA